MYSKMRTPHYSGHVHVPMLFSLEGSTAQGTPSHYLFCVCHRPGFAPFTASSIRPHRGVSVRASCISSGENSSCRPSATIPTSSNHLLTIFKTHQFLYQSLPAITTLHLGYIFLSSPDFIILGPDYHSTNRSFTYNTAEQVHIQLINA